MVIVCRIVPRRITCGQARRVPYRPSPDRVRSGSSCAVSPVAGHGVGEGRRVRYRLSPVTAWGRVIACRIVSRRARRGEGSSRAVSSVAGSGAVMARRPITGRHLLVRIGDLISLPCPRSGEPNTRRLPCPGPTAPVADAACSGLRTFILLLYLGASLCPRRRRG